MDQRKQSHAAHQNQIRRQLRRSRRTCHRHDAQHQDEDQTQRDQTAKGRNRVFPRKRDEIVLFFRPVKRFYRRKLIQKARGEIAGPDQIHRQPCEEPVENVHPQQHRRRQADKDGNHRPLGVAVKFMDLTFRDQIAAPGKQRGINDPVQFVMIDEHPVNIGIFRLCFPRFRSDFRFHSCLRHGGFLAFLLGLNLHFVDRIHRPLNQFKWNMPGILRRRAISQRHHIALCSLLEIRENITLFQNGDRVILPVDTKILK